MATEGFFNGLLGGMARRKSLGYPRRVLSSMPPAARWLDRHAVQDGQRRALVDADRELNYAALFERTKRCAAMLRGAGIGRGDRVALLLGNRTAYIEVVFAAARLGAIAVPLNARLTAPEIQRLLDDCTPRGLLHESSLETTVSDTCRAMETPPTFRMSCGGSCDPYEAALASAQPLESVEPMSPDDPMLLIYTSGTTGIPRGALLPHRKTLFNNLNAQIFFDLTPEDRVLVPLPLFHSFGLLILTLPALYTGASAYLMPRFDPALVWEFVERERITHFGGVPSMFQALLEALEDGPSKQRDRTSLRFLFSAGAAVSKELVRAFDAHQLALRQGYGQTETSILCCLEMRDAVRKAGSVGRPVVHAELRLVVPSTLAGPIESWRNAGVGEIGEIVVRGPINFLGYWNRPADTAETLRGEWLRTADLATIDDEGFVTLVGRARELYISGGENVYPAEVEGVFAEHPAIREIAIVGVPDAKWGETGVAYVVAAEKAAFDACALLSWGRERLARFKLPSQFILVDKLPKTASGKIQKHRLHAPTG